MRSEPSKPEGENVIAWVIPTLKEGMEPTDFWRNLTERARAVEEDAEMDPFLALGFWAAWLVERVRHGYDAVVVITGDEGSGKSTLSLRLLLEVKRLLKLAWEPNEVCYSALDLITAYKSITDRAIKGWPVWYDEGVRGSSAYDNPLSPESKAIVKALALVRESGAILVALYPSIWLAAKQIRARRACLWIHVVRRGLGRVHERDRRLNYLPTDALGLTISPRAPHVAWEPFAPTSKVWVDYLATKNRKLKEFLAETEAELKVKAGKAGESKFLNFEKDGKAWRVENKKGEPLGRIAFYPPWRKHVFTPEGEAVFDTVCQADLSSFLSALDHKREPTPSPKAEDDSEPDEEPEDGEERTRAQTRERVRRFRERKRKRAKA